jgi:hypothetical protein
MFFSRYRGILPLVIDGLLLVAMLQAWFWLRPAEQPEGAMLVVAVLVRLLVGGKPEHFNRRGLISGFVIGGLCAWYWKQPLDVLPVAAWFGMTHFWRHLVRNYARLNERYFEPLRAHPWMAAVRIAGLVGSGGLLMQPYLTEGLVGAGDAVWYTNTVADYVVQMRAGFFPPWVGQSDYSMYGGSFPVRFAPYLAHLAGGIDLMTGRQLPVYAVLNAVLIVSVIGALLVMYFCLRGIMPGRPWTRMGLALCYGLCPGVLGLAYAQDLYMSICTLPFLPVAFLGVFRSFERNDFGARLLMVGGVAAAWLAHPPIGMWCGLLVGATQMVRWFRQDSWRAVWRYDAMAVGMFVLLAGYSAVSVRSLGPVMSGGASLNAIVTYIKQAFPDNWRPIHTPIRSLANLQLGYGLAALGLVAALFARGPEQRMARIFLGCAAALTVLVLPIPFLGPSLWRAMPQAVLNITNVWPVQRLMVLTAISVIFGAAAWLGAFRGTAWLPRGFNALLIGGMIWGGFEVTKFIEPANVMSGGWGNAEKMARPENRPMTNAALGTHPVRPRYFNHGVTNVALEHRFLAPDTKEIIRNATDAIKPGFGPGSGAGARQLTRQFTGRVGAETAVLELEPTLILEPGKHYLLVMEFLEHDYTGVLLMVGRDFSRLYGLPSAGDERSFGAKPANARWLALWQTTGQREEVRLRWVPTGAGARPESYVPFANFELREYDPAALDVVLESLVPYRATVKAPAASYLETPRLWTRGYEAIVDGRPAPVEMSPDGFAMVRLEPGRHVLELNYVAPLAVRLAYYLGLAAWLGFAVVSGRYFWQARAQRRAS